MTSRCQEISGRMKSETRISLDPQMLIGRARKYLICYFDLLGQRNALRPFTTPGKYSEGDKLRAAKAMTLFKDIRGSLEKSFSTGLSNQKFFEIYNNADPGGMGGKDTCELLDDGQRTDYGVRQFSDSFILYADAKSPVATYAFMRMLHRLCELMIQAHACRLYPRGALTVNDAWHMEDGVLCGPAIDEVDSLEKSVADYSRIIFSSRLVDMMGWHNHLFDYDGKYDISLVVMGSLCNNNHELDYLREVFSGELTKKYRALIGDVLNCAYSHICSNELEMEKAAEGENIAAKRALEKIRRLREYYDKSRESVLSAIGKVKPVGMGQINPDAAYDVADYMVLYVRYWRTVSKAKNVRQISELVRIIKSAVAESGGEVGKDCGLQQLSRYAMLYVRNRTGANAATFFCRTVASVFKRLCRKCKHRKCKCAPLYVMTVAYGKGWNVGDGILYGPVIGSAHKAVMAKAGCITMTQDFRDSVLKKLHLDSDQSVACFRDVPVVNI